jgi:stearoyl-CoA desaturase (delta-9 desaturase)
MSVQLRERPAAVATRGVVRLDAKQLRAQRRITLTLTVLPLAAVVSAISWFWGHAISGRDLGIMLFFYSATCIGITVGYHRLFTHRSFRAVWPLRLALAIAGSMAVQGSVISWVATHRRHHAYADDYGDPHSPHLAQAAGFRGVLLGLYHAHVGWLFDSERSDASEWAPDMLADPAMARVDRSFGWLTLATFLLPAFAGGLISWTWGGMVSGLLWGSLVRVFLLHHMTWSINSICHFYGREAYQARDESKNVWPLALSSFGESWHNNHHAFPWSARLGLRGWQIDPGWYVIRLLKAFRVIVSVKVPSKAQILAKLKQGAEATHRAA